MPYLIIVMAAACAGYGWCLERRVNIAVPLILQFISALLFHLSYGTKLMPRIVGYISITIMNAASTLMIDLAPGQSSSVTACVCTSHGLWKV